MVYGCSRLSTWKGLLFKISMYFMVYLLSMLLYNVQNLSPKYSCSTWFIDIVGYQTYKHIGFIFWYVRVILRLSTSLGYQKKYGFLIKDIHVEYCLLTFLFFKMHGFISELFKYNKIYRHSKLSKMYGLLVKSNHVVHSLSMFYVINMHGLITKIFK